MGYTHYWTYNKSDSDSKQFAKAVQEIKKLLATEEVKSISLCGEADDKEPILQEDKVFLNGVGVFGLEDFCVVLDEPGWDFCKTDRKPYGLVVMLCLIAFANNLNDFTFKSNGDEWLPARKLYEAQINCIKPGIFN